MKIVDIMASYGKVFLKSEWAPISNEWPCVSFTKKSVGDRLRTEFRPGRDVLLYVGTTNPEMTEDPEHRGRVLSAVVIQPNQVLATRKIVPAAIWESSVARWGYDRWPYAMAVIRATNVVSRRLPHAHDIVPKAYRSFAEFVNRGGVVEARGEERADVMGLEVSEITLELSKAVHHYLQMMEAVSPEFPLAVRQEIARMGTLIQQRVSKGGEASVKINPQRYAPNISDLITVLTSKWKDQRHQCACGGHLFTFPTNPMLKPSADRIESENGAYTEDNVQITHFACNLAKNQYGAPEFREWLDVVRGEDMSGDQLVIPGLVVPDPLLPDFATLDHNRGTFEAHTGRGG